MSRKVVPQKYVAPVWNDPDPMDSHRLYALTDHDINTLMALLVPAHWTTRWDNAPSQDALDEYVSELEDQLMSPLNICNLIEECDALTRCCREQRPGPLPEDWRDNPIVPQPDGCNLDALWASCDELVERLDQIVVDQIEKVEASTNTIELAAELLQGTTFTSATIADEVLQTVSWFQDTVGENYLAAVTTAVKDDLKCALFCAAKDSDLCAVNETILFDELAVLTGQSFLGDNIFGFITKLLTGTYTGGQVAYAAWMFIVGWARFTSIVPILSSSYSRELEIAIWAGYADPRGGWVALCDCPVEWSEDVDFCTDPFNSRFELVTGLLQTGDCQARAVFDGGSTNRVFVRLTIPATSSVTSVRVIAHVTSDGSPRGIFLRSPTGSPAFAYQTWTSSGDRDETFEDLSLTGTTLDILVDGYQHDYSRVARLVVSGTGQNPFEGS